MTKLLVAVCLLAMLALPSCAAVDTESAAQAAVAHYKIGVAYLGENKIQQAFLEFQRAHELNPRNKEVLNAIGIVYLQHFDETAKAIEHFEKAVRVAPDYSDAYNNLGVAQEKLGNFEAAISHYRKALSNLLYSTPEKAYINMGNSYYRLRRYESAIGSYKEAIKRAPGLAQPYFGLALCYNGMARYGEASTAITHAIKLDPVYRGDREKAAEDLAVRRLSATGYERQDLTDYLEILKY